MMVASTAILKVGLERYRQLQFLFDLVTEFKSRGCDELDLPRERVKNFLGAHSGTYQRRIEFAKTAGIPTEALHRAVQERRIDHYDFGSGGWSQDDIFFDASMVQEAREMYRVPAKLPAIKSAVCESY